MKQSQCEHAYKEKQQDEWCGRQCTREVWTCELDCTWECDECDGEGNYEGGERDE